MTAAIGNRERERERDRDGGERSGSGFAELTKPNPKRKQTTPLPPMKTGKATAAAQQAEPPSGTREMLARGKVLVNKEEREDGRTRWAGGGEARASLMSGPRKKGERKKKARKTTSARGSLRKKD
jgi:hypothetical protein